MQSKSEGEWEERLGGNIPDCLAVRDCPVILRGRMGHGSPMFSRIGLPQYLGHTQPLVGNSL